MPRQFHFYVYILASLSGTLYVGLTDNLKRRIEEHRLGLVDSFTKKYKVNRLMYYEIFRHADAADAREKQKYRREKKIALFVQGNPHWEDLSKDISWTSKKMLM
ncbi:MAG TPA: GIY-YIG nuclease family protein [Candidatus Angelobacter sp.]|jgi:putative endonuclease|nr:GIY-YIG nuclease family protein [Candidatus Angelobacter sp.]